jgi:hypothetical protein
MAYAATQTHFNSTFSFSLPFDFIHPPCNPPLSPLAERPDTARSRRHPDQRLERLTSPLLTRLDLTNYLDDLSYTKTSVGQYTALKAIGAQPDT